MQQHSAYTNLPHVPRPGHDIHSVPTLEYRKINAEGGPVRDVVTPEKREQIKHLFIYHPPQPGQAAAYQLITEKCLDLALLICELTPESDEQKLAIDTLRSVRAWANEAIANG